jgi:twinkle protein
MNLTDEEIDRLIEQQQSRLELDEVKSASYWQERLIANEDRVHGVVMPWAMMDGRFELRPGELSVWAGESGSGKSMMISQIMAHLLRGEDKVLIASLEMRPEETLRRMITQCAGNPNPSEDWVREWFAGMDDRLFLYNKLDTVEAKRMVNATRAAAEFLGVTHVVIDSLTKCRLPTDGPGHLSAQTDFIDSLQWTAKHIGVHIHLVAHMRKPEGSRRALEASKFDIRGASQITDLADNVLLLTRNYQKEKALADEQAGVVLDDQERQLLDECDAFLRVDKQRHNGDHRTYGLWYDKNSLSFVPSEGQRIRWEQPW